MDIAYSVVAGPNGPLAEYAAVQGNFGLFAQQILDQLTGLPVETEGKRSFPYQGFKFHTMVSQGMTYICVAVDSFEVRRAFAFLADIKTAWLSQVHLVNNVLLSLVSLVIKDSLPQDLSSMTVLVGF